MAPVRRFLVVALLAGAVSACAPAADPGPSQVALLSADAARAKVLASTSAATATSFSTTFITNLTEAASGPNVAEDGIMGASGGATLTLSTQVTAESATRVLVRSSATLHGRPPAAEIREVYDGALYVSDDNGASYKKATFNGSVPAGEGTDTVLQYIQAAQTVTDNGPTTDGSAVVDRFSCLLDQARAKQVILASAATAGDPSAAAVLQQLTVGSAVLDIDLDKSGRPVFEQLAVTASVNLSDGDTVTITNAGSGYFTGYGSTGPIAVPSNITATVPLSSLS